MGAKKNFVIDTNVILHDYNCLKNFQENDIYLPIVVLEELDKFKKGGESNLLRLPAARRVDTSERFASKGVAGQYRAYQGDDGQWRGESIGSGKYGSGTAECPPK